MDFGRGTSGKRLEWTSPPACENWSCWRDTGGSWTPTRLMDLWVHTQPCWSPHCTYAHVKHGSADVVSLCHFKDLQWPGKAPEVEWELVDSGSQSTTFMRVPSTMLRSGSEPRLWGSEDCKCPGEGIGLQKLPVSSLDWLTLSTPCGEAVCWSDFLRYRPCSFSELFIRCIRYDASDELGLSVSYF